MTIETFTEPKQVGDFTVYDVTPVPGGNCLLFAAADVCFAYDSGFGFSSDALCENVEKVLRGRSLDYILLTHSHYDHAFGSAALRLRCPGCRVIAHSYAAYVFTREGAKKTMLRLDNTEAERRGYDTAERYIDHLHVDIPVEDGQELMLENHRVRVLCLPGHTRDSIGFLFPESGMLLGCETAGVIINHRLVMPATLVGFDTTMDSLAVMERLPVRHYFIPHQGMVDEEGYNEYIRMSRHWHETARSLILESFRAGKSREEILDRFRDTFYLEGCSEIYPPAAFRENVNIMIHTVLQEAGYL